jgi:hypothetical protein
MTCFQGAFAVEMAVALGLRPLPSVSPMTVSLSAALMKFVGFSITYRFEPGRVTAGGVNVSLSNLQGFIVMCEQYTIGKSR